MTLGTQALAQVTATYGGDIDRVELALPVTSSVAGKCGFSSLPSASVALGNLETGFDRELPFVIDCNGPVRVAVVSQNGALAAPGNAPPGFSRLLVYTVTLQLVGNGGVSVWDSCRSSALQVGAADPCSFRGPASPTVGLRLPKGSNKEGSYVQTAAPPTSGLAASQDYEDVLTLTVSPSA